MWPVSSGSRRASSAARGNSGSSSKNNTPWWASEISPGRGGDPPPTSATALAVWWGWRVGRRPQSSGRKLPARLATAALSSASSTCMAGSSPAKRCASMDLPEPGGPTIKRPWPPAAAISSARRAAVWPFTSARSGPPVGLRGGCACSTAQPSLGAGGSAPGGRKACTTSSRWRARTTRAPGTRAASSALPGGSTRQAVLPCVCSARLVARAPRTGRSSPDKDSSPANSCPASRLASICPLAARMPSAIGRSNRPESLGRSAGARFTVMRLLLGKSSPAFCRAERTRSRASFTSTSARPTSVKLGRPLARCTSTVTAGACSPRRARLCTNARLMAG